MKDGSPFGPLKGGYELMLNFAWEALYMHMYLSRLSVSKAVTQCLIPMCFSFLAATASAAGMKPDTTIVFVDVADKEGTINVTNTDNGPLLLLTSLSSIPEDKESLLVVDPPISRLEAGQKQLVRFIVQAKQPITTQRLKRVTFEGIPQEKPGTSSTVSVNVRQNIPVIIHPAGLAQKSDPWFFSSGHSKVMFST